MKALTLHQPWSWAIAHAGKRVENRTWAPPASVIGQRVAIHAGLRLDKRAVDSVGTLLMNACQAAKATRDPGLFKAALKVGLDFLAIDEGQAAFVHGAVESVATIAGWVSVTESGATYHNEARLPHLRSPWFIGPIGWVLADVIALPEPVPCKGAQGLWTLPADVESAVLAQIGRAS